MKHARRRIPALSLLALLTCPLFAMATAPDERVFPPRTLAIELDRSTLLNPTHVSYEWTKEGLEIKGRIEKRGDRYGRILGHAEIELLDAQGHLLSSHRGALQYFNPRSKDPDWASFETVIESVPSNAVKLRICHALGSERCPH